MKDKLHIDFETRSLVDIKKVGAYAYAAHPSTEILCVAYVVNNEPVKTIPYGDKYGMTDLYPHLDRVVRGYMVMSAFNAFFERCIFKFVVPRMKLLRGKYPDIWKPQYWQCTMAKACQAGMTGSLDVVCQLLKLKETKDKDGYRVMMKMAKPRKPKKAEWKQLIKEGCVKIDNVSFMQPYQKQVQCYDPEKDDYDVDVDTDFKKQSLWH